MFGTRDIARPEFRLHRYFLLQLNLGARFLERRLDLVGLFLVHALFDRLRRALDKVFGLFQAQPSQRTHLFNDLDLLVAGAGENDCELGLLLSRSSATTSSTTTGSNRNSSSSRNAPLLFEHLGEIGRLEDGQG